MLTMKRRMTIEDLKEKCVKAFWLGVLMFVIGMSIFAFTMLVWLAYSVCAILFGWW